MKRYLLDTCVIKWYLENDTRIKSIAEDIEYYQGDYAVSIESIKELVYLVQSKKIKLDFDYEEFTKLLTKGYFDIIDFDIDSLKVLFSLPFYKNHSDPTDRHIISTAIAKKRILISGDVKFNKYRKNGLLFLEV